MAASTEARRPPKHQLYLLPSGDLETVAIRVYEVFVGIEWSTQGPCLQSPDEPRSLPAVSPSAIWRVLRSLAREPWPIRLRTGIAVHRPTVVQLCFSCIRRTAMLRLITGVLSLQQLYHAYQSLGGFFQARLKAFGDYLDLSTINKVFDICCGPGHIAANIPQSSTTSASTPTRDISGLPTLASTAPSAAFKIACSTRLLLPTSAVPISSC